MFSHQAKAVISLLARGKERFFRPENVELFVKVHDGRPVNGHFWVFLGALSNVGYTVTVTDTQTGAMRDYVNEPGTLRSFGDTRAFPE